VWGKLGKTGMELSGRWGRKDGRKEKQENGQGKTTLKNKKGKNLLNLVTVNWGGEKNQNKKGGGEATTREGEKKGITKISAERSRKGKN